MTPAIFELGGKSPNIVLDDADLDAAAIGVTLASVFTFNAGQACVAGSRILVQRPVLEEMLERIEAIGRATVLGDPFDSAATMGPLISQEQYDKVVAFIDAGEAEAELLFGGRHGGSLVPDRPGGYWVEPTLFLAKDNAPRICREEVFGPVAVVIPFDSDDEAIALANDTRYGLAAGVWTTDLQRVHRFVREIHAGNVWVNTYMQTRYELPFGGIKDSGYGHDEVSEFSREKGRSDLRRILRRINVVTDARPRTVLSRLRKPVPRSCPSQLQVSIIVSAERAKGSLRHITVRRTGPAPPVPRLQVFFQHITPAMERMRQLVREGEAPADVMQMYASEDAKRGRNDPCTCGSGD